MSPGRTLIPLLRSCTSPVGAQLGTMSLNSSLLSNRLLELVPTLLVERISTPALLSTIRAPKPQFWCPSLRSSSHRCSRRRDLHQLALKSKSWRKLLPNRVLRLQGTHLTKQWLSLTLGRVRTMLVPIEQVSLAPKAEPQCLWSRSNRSRWRNPAQSNKRRIQSRLVSTLSPKEHPAWINLNETLAFLQKY
jgi:hypothetical protein